ncbi:MAG: putative glycoside hydrolase [Patescibacteria group bacterium]|nr:putative glycoside hydrolase [Patescibacteria group bacterium]
MEEIKQQKRENYLRTGIYTFFVVLFYALLIYANKARALEVKEEYPKIANYFLNWSINENEIKELAKWDILILDIENQNSPEKIKKIREINPKIIILAYITPQEINIECKKETPLRCELLSQINSGFYLKDQNEQKLSFWDGTNLLNIADNSQNSWNNTFSNFINNKILSSNIWDGIFYDNLWDNVSWINNGNIDSNNDNRKDDPNFLDNNWKNGIIKILKATKKDNSIILGNSATNLEYYDYINGRMFESFPAKWENNGDWESLMEKYINKYPEKAQLPNIFIVNSNTDDTGNMNNYKKMRFGLTSTLLGDGYFSFDSGEKAHSQTWWYDEYKVNLGKSESEPYNILENDNTLKNSLWRRDFENGIVLVNSTNEDKIFIFDRETFEKINGTQDKQINDGSKINYIKISAHDGIILLKVDKKIINNTYINGSFVRVFDNIGSKKYNGFFSYKARFEGSIKILETDLDKDKKNEILTSKNGKIDVYKTGNLINSFFPYTESFKKEISFTTNDINNDGNVEIITGAGPGGGPHIRVFNSNFEVISQFFAYDKNFRGGVSVATGDINEDNKTEIIIGLIINKKLEIKIFDNTGKLLNNFVAGDFTDITKIQIMSYDIDNDEKNEILVGTTSF